MKLRQLLLPLAACALLVPVGAASASFTVVPPSTSAPAVRTAPAAPTIRSAARAYLRFVGPSNRVNAQLNARVDSLSQSDLSGWKALMHARYLYTRHYISGLTRIRWPQRLRPVVNRVVLAAAAVAATEDDMSSATTWYWFNSMGTDAARAYRAERVAVSLLRVNLGLPQVL